MEAQRQANGPWEFIGGSVGKLFGASDPSSPPDGLRMAQNTCGTCAARLSWALNHCFAATAVESGVIPSVQAGGGTVFRNDPNVTYGGNAGDAMNYIVGAPAMHLYLTNQWGAPDTRLSNLDVYATDPVTGSRTRTSEGDASALRAKLGPNKIAVFAGAYHVGVISQQLRTDDYIYYDPHVVPAVAWILP